MRLGLLRDGRADLADARMHDRLHRRRVREADGLQLLAGQVEAPALGILIDVAQMMLVSCSARPWCHASFTPSASGMPKMRTEGAHTALATRSQ